MEEAQKLADFILGKNSLDQFNSNFEGKYSENFNPEKDLEKIGVVNQTTMLATETQEITDFLRQTMVEKHGDADIKKHIADTRDTLCYATNDNQSSTIGLLDIEADLAIVVGGYNSSNTTHLVELLEQKFPCYFINDETKLLSKNEWSTFDIHKKIEENLPVDLNKKPLRIIISSGASCPDATVDRVIQRILELSENDFPIEEALAKMA